MMDIRKAAILILSVFGLAFPASGQKTENEPIPHMWFPNGTLGTLKLVPSSRSERSYDFVVRNMQTIEAGMIPRSIEEGYALLPETPEDMTLAIVVFELDEENGNQSYMLVRSGFPFYAVYTVCPAPMDENGFVWHNKRCETGSGETTLVKMKEGAEGALILGLFRLPSPEEPGKAEEEVLFGEDIQ